MIKQIQIQIIQIIHIHMNIIPNIILKLLEKMIMMI